MWGGGGDVGEGFHSGEGTTNLASCSLQNLREIQLHDLTTHLDIFEDHRENDYEEMLHRFQDIRVEFTEPHEVYRMLTNMTQQTPAEVYFLSILQHLLLVRDDYWARSVWAYVTCVKIGHSIPGCM